MQARRETAVEKNEPRVGKNESSADIQNEPGIEAEPGTEAQSAYAKGQSAYVKGQEALFELFKIGEDNMRRIQRFLSDDYLIRAPSYLAAAIERAATIGTQSDRDCLAVAVATCMVAFWALGYDAGRQGTDEDDT